MVFLSLFISISSLPFVISCHRSANNWAKRYAWTSYPMYLETSVALPWIISFFFNIRRNDLTVKQSAIEAAGCPFRKILSRWAGHHFLSRTSHQKPGTDTPIKYLLSLCPLGLSYRITAHPADTGKSAFWIHRSVPRCGWPVRYLNGTPIAFAKDSMSVSFLIAVCRSLSRCLLASRFWNSALLFAALLLIFRTPKITSK